MKLRPTFSQGFIFLLGGIAFAFFGCLGAIAGFSSNETAAGALGVIGAIAFVGGIIVLLIGVMLLVIATFKAMFGTRDAVAPPVDAPPSAPPDAPPPPPDVPPSAQTPQ